MSSRLARSRYFAWFTNDHPPSISSSLRPSMSGDLLCLSGDVSVDSDASHSSIVMPASLARPTGDPNTSPCWSASDSRVIQSTLVSLFSAHTEDVIRFDDSFVYVSMLCFLVVVLISRDTFSQEPVTCPINVRVALAWQSVLG